MVNADSLGKDKILPLMLKMALPTMLAQIVNLLYNIVDKIYIGHIKDIGGDALTGVGLTSALILIISAFSSFVSNGGAPLASIELGKKNNQKAEKILGNGFTFLIIISVILMIAFYLFQDFYFNLVGGSNITTPYGKDYLNIYLIGTIFVMISLGLNNFLTVQGKSTIAMLSIVIGALINIALDPLFIFVFHLGVKGAALATVISQGVSATWIIFMLTRKNLVLKLRLVNLKLDRNIMKGVLCLGISPFVMAITESLITLTLSGQLKKYGDDNYVGSLTILQSVMQLMSTPLTGFTQGVTPLMSYNYGAKNNDRLKEIVKYLFIFLFVYTLTFAISTMIFPSFYASIFTDKKEIIEIVKVYLPTFMAGMTIFGIQRACQTTFIATGQAKISLFIALLRKVILLIPLAFILPLLLKVKGVYVSEVIADASAAIICGIIFIFLFPKILKRNTKEVEQ